MSHFEMIELSKKVSQYAIDRFRLNLSSIHGPMHWKSVLKYGLDIQTLERRPIDRTVLLLFSLLHDVERFDDGLDPEHGIRAAQLIPTLQGRLFTLEPPQVEMLVDACIKNVTGEPHPNLNVQICMDAHRLNSLNQKVDPNDLQIEAARIIANKMNEVVEDDSAFTL